MKMKRTVTLTLMTMAAAILLAGCRQAPRFWKGADKKGEVKALSAFEEAYQMGLSVK